MKRVGTAITSQKRNGHEDRVNLYAGFRGQPTPSNTQQNATHSLESVILHLDIDCFFAQVEQIDNPELRGKPVIVGGRKIIIRENEDEIVQPTKSHPHPTKSPAEEPPEPWHPTAGQRVTGRGVVCTSSYEARARGVRTAMPMAQAVALCPEAICVGGNYHRYSEVSQAVFEVVGEFSPAVRMASLDEAYVDITGLERWTQKLERQSLGTIYTVKSGVRHTIPAVDSTTPWPIIFAAALKHEIHRRTGIIVSIGVGPNVFIAKVGSAQCKPNGLLYVSASEQADYARSLSARAVPGVGAVTAGQLQRYGIESLNDVLKTTLPTMVQQFGNLGRMLHQRALGNAGPGLADLRLNTKTPVEDAPGSFVRSSEAHKSRGRRSMSRETTFNEDISDRAHLLSVLGYLTERVGWSLRREGLQASCISVKMRLANFKTLSRDRTLSSSTGETRFTDLDHEIYTTVCSLFSELLARRGTVVKGGRSASGEGKVVEPIRLIGVRLSHLSDHADRQLGFDEIGRLERQQRLLKAADLIRDRFGFGSVALGRSINLMDISKPSGVRK